MGDHTHLLNVPMGGKSDLTCINCSREEIDMSASTVNCAKNNTWVDDSMVTRCFHCDSEFGFFRRRHHCRCCGNIFCFQCCDNYVQIPEYISDRPEAEDYWNIGYYTSILRGPEERVCDRCRDLIAERKKAHAVFAVLVENPPSVRELKNDLLCTAEMKNQYLHTLRNIQYNLPETPYSPVEKKLLHANANLFAGHSKYIVHLLKTTTWGSPAAEAMAARVLANRPICTCEELWCTRTCQPRLSTDDCMHVLWETHAHLPNSIINILTDTVALSPEPVLLCHIPLLIRLLLSTANRTLIGKLVSICSHTKQLFYQSYWRIRSEIAEGEPNLGAQCFYSSASPQDTDCISREYEFYRTLLDHLADPIPYLRSSLSKGPVSLPYAPQIHLLSVVEDSVSVKDSCTQPVCIKFQTDGDRIVELLFKREDIENDISVLNLMTLCGIILEDYLHQDFPVIVYPAMRLCASGGMIEIVQGAQTVYSICKGDQTILQHIVLENSHRLVSDVLRRYMQSLVMYTLQNYFIGLGDRHLQNIMITADGSIFHIDFGYILGDEVHLTSSEIKISTDMIEALGGEGGDGLYSEYLDLCARGTTILRKHYVLFYLLLQNGTNNRRVNRFIQNRFQPRQTDQTAADSIVSVIKSSSEGYGGYVVDFFHYHSQEKTVQTGFSQAFRSARSWIVGRGQ